MKLHASVSSYLSNGRISLPYIESMEVKIEVVSNQLIFRAAMILISSEFGMGSNLDQSHQRSSSNEIRSSHGRGSVDNAAQFLD